MKPIKLYIDDNEIGIYDSIKDIITMLEGTYIYSSWWEDNNKLYIETANVILT